MSYSAVIALALAGMGCVSVPEEFSRPTATDTRADRILVTVTNPASRVAHLSPSGRSAYNPETARERRAAHLAVARRLAEEHDFVLEEDWPIPALDVHCFVFRLPNEEQRDRIIAGLERRKDIESVQALQFFQGQTGAGTNRTSGNVSGSPDPLANWNDETYRWLLAVHQRSTGTGTKIAFIDTGADLDHEDLQGSTLHAIDMVDGNDHVPPESHGTAIVGLVSARPDNGIGIRGLAPDAELLLMRACWETGDPSPRAICNTFTLARALSVAIDSGVDIVNLSISGPRDPLLERLAERIVSNGTLMMSAGDETGFPGSVVGSVLVSRYLSSQAMLTLLPGNRYGMRDGTSMSTATASALAALAKQLSPDMTRAEFELTFIESGKSASKLPNFPLLKVERGSH